MSDNDRDLVQFVEGVDDRGITRRGMTVLGRGISEQRWLFTAATVAAILAALMTIADAWVLGWATDNVIVPSFEDGDVARGALVIGVLAFITVAILRALGTVGRRLLGGLVYLRLSRSYRERVTRKYLDLPLSWHQRRSTGTLLSNANSDVDESWFVFGPLPMAIGTIAMVFTALGTMFAADPFLTLVGLVIFPALFVLNIVYQRMQSPRFARAQSLRGSVSAVAHESFDGALVVKSLGREDAETERFAAISNRLRDANISVGRLRAVFDPILDSLPNLGILAVIVIGVIRVDGGHINAGDVVQVAFLFTVIAMPIRAIGWVLFELPGAVVSSDRVWAVLDEDASIEYGDHEIHHDGSTAVEIKHVTFSFHDAPDDPVLRDLDFTVPAGTTTAIVGATGSGKSTLASLLVRLVDPQRGRIHLKNTGSIDIRDLTHQNLAATVALVPQQTFIFDDSVRSNVTLGADVDDDEVWRVLRAVQADQFVAELSQGLDTQLGERGTSLSGGQRQRLALARALIRKPAVLVMDDATSAIDPQVEQRILAALARQSVSERPPTVVVVAYRKATISLADEVIFLDEGRVVDRGTHDELHRRNADYRALVDAYEVDG